ncbi:MAG TPA: FkbM family methyltransferase [Polyangia bacterium]|nr:FkbM family methyltransferase [Polyangia bacterium]
MTGAAAAQLDAATDAYRAGRLADAEAICRAIVAADPGCGPAWERLALTCDRLGRPAEAIAALQTAVGCLSEPADALHNLGVLLHRQGALDAALAHYRRAAQAGCSDPRLLSNLGCLLRDRGLVHASGEELARAVAADGGLASTQSNLGVTLCLQGRVGEALPHLRLGTVLAPDWPVGWSNLLLCLGYADDLPPAAVAAAHRIFGQRFAGRRFARPSEPPARPLEVGERRRRPLRVGLVSPDLRRHAVAFFLEPLLEARDRAAVSYLAYSTLNRVDSVTERLRALVDEWRPIDTLGDEEAAAAIRADGVDILIDLAGHTAHNRLGVFARRPAPLQMTYLGYAQTTGLPTIDWRITDAWADPPGATEHLHTERLLRLPSGFLCYRPPPDSPPVAELPADRQGRVTFASFNQLAKISPRALALWGRVLDAAPGSRLFIKGPAFAETAMRAAFAERLGATALARHDVQLLPPQADQRAHLEAYGDVDIALDTTPYCGTTTTCEALWMGAPVVTLVGSAHAGRVGASILSRAGLPALCAATPDDYVRVAAALAADRPRLRALRAGLRARVAGSGLTDGAAFARAFEAALGEAWRARVDRDRPPAAARPAGTMLARMDGDIDVVVGDGPDELTAYVLAEQQDWFEDEIAFVRAAACRGERAIDVGANHGVYALSLARAVGPDGHVFAFEPEPTAAARLAASVAANHFGDTVTLVASALSDRAGRQRLCGGTHSELAALGGSGRGSGADAGSGPEVAVTTLDESALALGLRDIAFIKIDAEGAEPPILRGGRAFFMRESPLMMIEVRQGATIAAPTIAAIAELGYDRYRLVPGLTLLAPAGDPGALDPFVLNLFACKPDRATALEERGLLVARARTAEDAPAGAWLVHLRPLALAQAVGLGWRGQQLPPERAYFGALDHYALAQRPLEPAATRLAHLMKAVELAGEALARAPSSIPELATTARLAADAGYRAIAAQTLHRLALACDESGDVALDPAIPFLPPCPRFDHVPLADGDLRRWLLAAALEQRERLRAFSSYYTASDPATLAALETIAALGYGGGEMARRLALARRRAAIPR